MRRNLTPLLIAIAGVIWVVVFLHLQDRRPPDAAFVTTPQDVVESMLELARVGPSDMVYDLGCGDGRIVVTAAKKYGCKAKGFDIDPECVRLARANAARNGVQDRVSIVEADLFKLDLHEATVITIYLKPHLNAQLVPQLDQLGSGVRIVSHYFSMPGVTPEKATEMKSKQDDSGHPLYLWVTPLKHSASAQQIAEAPFPYDTPPWGIVAVAGTVAILVFLLLSRCPSALLAAGAGAVITAALAWWALGCGRGFMIFYVQMLCSGVFALVGASSGWVAASMGKARPKKELSGASGKETSAENNAAGLRSEPEKEAERTSESERSERVSGTDSAPQVDRPAGS